MMIRRLNHEVINNAVSIAHYIAYLKLKIVMILRLHPNDKWGILVHLEWCENLSGIVASAVNSNDMVQHWWLSICHFNLLHLLFYQRFSWETLFTLAADVHDGSSVLIGRYLSSSFAFQIYFVQGNQCAQSMMAMPRRYGKQLQVMFPYKTNIVYEDIDFNTLPLLVLLIKRYA
ncbi:hypothetical protein C5167_017766 [Papaver somniferum]|uniref:Uncharacterized protein n=1 Tax=Papaver somniferum TaxID=3469 RepID=A0A4Y7IPC7_PAPSO|nr:hypothetical protein C5167_017766 [Papaver somniferum]